MLASLSLRLGPSPYTYFGTSTEVLLGGGGWVVVELPLARAPAGAAVMFLVETEQRGALWVDSASATAIADYSARRLTLAPPAATAIPRSYFGMHGLHMHEADAVYGNPILPWPQLDFGTYRTW
jgi:hypothetical protein